MEMMAKSPGYYGGNQGTVQQAGTISFQHTGGANLNHFMSNNPNMFHFYGNAASLIARLQGMSDQILHSVADAGISVTGTQLQELNGLSIFCVLFWGSIIILPLLLMCFNPWKRCTYPAYDVPIRAYEAIGRLIRGQNIKNMTLSVNDNCFDAQKAEIICQAVRNSRLVGFTFINTAGQYDFNNNEYSRFCAHMVPIKTQSHVISDIRWGEELVR